jgi:hypothetical protein
MRIKAGLALGLLLALSIAACGKNDEKNGVATAGGGKPNASANNGGGGGREAGLKYAQCMRANGVPNFPDPQVSDSGQISFNIPDDIPDYLINKAEEKCRDLRPFGPGASAQDPNRIEQLRKYAQCVRDNGIPEFPDPQDDGSSRFDPNKLGLSGPDDPKLKAAFEKCRQLQPSAPPGAQQQGNG